MRRRKTAGEKPRERGSIEEVSQGRVFALIRTPRTQTGGKLFGCSVQTWSTKTGSRAAKSVAGRHMARKKQGEH